MKGHLWHYKGAKGLRCYHHQDYTALETPKWDCDACWHLYYVTHFRKEK